MAHKVLGQVAPDPNTYFTLYTVPANKKTVISTIVCCNRATSGGSIRVAVCPGGATIANMHLIAYDILVPANSSLMFTIGITVQAADVIWVYASSGQFSFSAFGDES